MSLKWKEFYKNMAKFESLANEKEQPVGNVKTTITGVKNNIEREMKNSATGNIDEFVNGLKKKKKNRITRKKETERLGLTIEKDLYKKLKTLSWNSGESIAKITSKILEEALSDVKINEEDVAAFDDYFKKKKKVSEE